MSLEPSTRRQPCSLCESADFDILSKRDRKGRDLTTVVCRSCGMVSHEEIPSDEELTAYYESHYREDYHGESTPSPYRVVREWKRGRELLELLRSQLKAADKVLEVGSGIGCTVKNFELAGYATEGIEPGAGFCRFSREKLRAKVENSSLSDLPRSAQTDFVLLVHVLEHFNQPLRALAHLRDVLRPGGKLYVEVPNFGAPHAIPTKLFHYAHIFNFTSKTLMMAGEKSGFLVEKIMSGPTDKNLRMLFRRVENIHWTLDDESYSHSCAAYSRFNWLTYHARWSYLRQRLSTLWGRLVERRSADAQLQEILSLCDEHEATRKRLAA